MESLVSVIIPTCDRPHYIVEAINSVAQQTTPPAEIIVVDNGIKPLDLNITENNIHYIRVDPLIGASKARNIGAENAKGEFIAFLDDDDWWDPSFIEEALRVARDRSAKCVYGRKDVWKDGVTKFYKAPTESTLTVNHLLRNNPGTGGINLFVERKLFFKVGGFDSRLRASEDRSFALEVILSGEKIAYAPKAIAVMRNHSHNRLRHDPRHRIKFYWKYRHHMHAKEWISRIIKLYKKWLLNKIPHLSDR